MLTDSAGVCKAVEHLDCPKGLLRDRRRDRVNARCDVTRVFTNAVAALVSSFVHVRFEQQRWFVVLPVRSTMVTHCTILGEPILDVLQAILKPVQDLGSATVGITSRTALIPSDPACVVWQVLTTERG